MKRKLISKGVIVGLGLLMTISLFGCGDKAGKNDGVEVTTAAEHENETTSEQITEAETESAMETESVIDTEDKTEPESETLADEETESEKEDLDFVPIKFVKPEGFYSISELAVNYELKQTVFKGFDENGYLMPGMNGLYDRYEGEYSLTEGSKDKIVFVEYYDSLGVDDQQSYIEINGIKEEVYIDHIFKVAVIDIDTTDKYKEIALYDVGPSADPHIKLFRFCDGEIYKVGEYATRFYEEIFYTDSKGKIVDGCGYIFFIENPFVYKYHTIVNNEDTVVDVNYEKYLNQTYTIVNEIHPLFYESDNSNLSHKDLVYSYPDEYTPIRVGETIKLIKIVEPVLFYVQLPDGRYGYILTQTAG